MDKEAVLKILGEPNNSPKDDAWVYCFEDFGDLKLDKWHEVYDSGAGFFYVLFYQDKLITPIPEKSSASNPWDSMANTLGLGDRAVQELIGERRSSPRLNRGD